MRLSVPFGTFCKQDWTPWLGCGAAVCHPPGWIGVRGVGPGVSGKRIQRLEPRIGAGDFFEIPPGHDAYVDGPERVELILFSPPEHQH